MPPRRRIGKRLVKSFLPIVLVLGLALVGSLAFIIYCVTRPARRPYVVTPHSFALISGRAVKVSDETWTTRDARSARGWLLKGAEGAPAVVLVHRYGGDRSWLFNLGVKLNDTTNFTILWPELRGHGEKPPIGWTSLGVRDGDDLLAAIEFLQTLKSENQRKLVGESVGVYGVELGAYSGLKAASQDNRIKILVLDSISSSPDEMLNTAVSNCVAIDNGFVHSLSRAAMKIYMLGGYDSTPACDLARSAGNQRVLLLSGAEAGRLRDSTAAIQSCFPNQGNVQARIDLPLSGFSLPSATGEQGEAYDRVVIDFFDTYLR